MTSIDEKSFLRPSLICTLTMAPLIVPSPDVRYRIHNVDFRTYLEGHCLVDVGVRHFKESSQQQVFVSALKFSSKLN